MAEEFQVGGSGNWWDTARNRIESGASPSSTTLTSIVSFGWPTEIVDNKAKSTMDSVSVSGPAPSIVFQDSLKLQASDSSSATAPGLLADPRLQIMGLALSSQGMDWNQALLRNEKAESSFGSALQEDMSTNPSFQQQEAGMGSAQDQWRHKLYSPGSSGDPSVVNEYKQMNRGFSLDQPQFNSQISSSDSTVTCQGYQMDSAVYASASTVLQGILASDNQSQLSNFDNRTVNYQYPSNYGLNSGAIMPSWTKFPQFLGNSPPKQPAPNSQLHFSNNTPFWNASAAGLNDVRSTFLPSLQPQFPSPSSFNEKPSKNTSEVRDLGTVAKKSSSEPSTKRPRNETPSPLPAFKVRKEKMGDRITALQQLVSPFGKTDTASVLSETIEYIKFLHEQVKVLSTPYMKSGAALQHQQQNSDKSKDGEGPNQDLRSRGLCLVPVSSTFPVTHETTVDFWNPTFGGTFR